MELWYRLNNSSETSETREKRFELKTITEAEWPPDGQYWIFEDMPPLLIFGRFINASIREFPWRGVLKCFQFLCPKEFHYPGIILRVFAPVQRLLEIYESNKFLDDFDSGLDSQYNAFLQRKNF
jgi:hypothetical protein